MTKTYAQIQKQIQELQKQAGDARKKEIAGVVGRIKEAIEAYGLTAEDLGLAGGGKRRGRPPKAAAVPAKRGRGIKTTAKRTVPPKYRDENGNTWAGRGARPRWLRDAIATGRKIEEFAI
jgi:DNA-binding protein H-NS